MIKVWKLVLVIMTGTTAAAVAGRVTNELPHHGCSVDELCADEGMKRFQFASDFFIALAYFSIPLELGYFVSCSQVLPFRWVFIQIEAFIVLCGLTHFIAIWTYGPHSYTVVAVQTIFKILTAAVSCATAITLIRVIPELLHVKVREVFLNHKAAELDREMDIIKTQEEVGRHVRMLTHEIRSTLDRHTILNTTLFELAKSLDLDNCTVWIPNRDGSALELTHELERRLVQVPVSVPAGDSAVQRIIQTREAVIIPPTCALGRASNHRLLAGAMVAVRLPLLHVSNFEGGTPKIVNTSYGILVLVLPSDSGRKWRSHELEMVEVVADQVAVALSHAAVLEESQCTREKLIDQNRSLQQARKDAETVIHARNNFLVVMNHEMRTPMHSITALSSLLQEGMLTTEQTSMVGTVVKCNSLLSTLLKDALDFSQPEERRLQLELAPFNLLMVLREAGNLSKLMAKGKGLEFSFQVEDNIPEAVVGDEKRLLQTFLNVVGHVIKFTKLGAVFVSVKKENCCMKRDPLYPTWEPPFCEGYVCIRVEVQGSELDSGKVDMSHVSDKFLQEESSTLIEQVGKLGLGPIRNKLIQLMQGHSWVEMQGPEKGFVLTFIIRLQLLPSTGSLSREKLLNNPDLQGLRVLVADDNSINRVVTRRLLDRLGCHTTVVESGHQCLATLVQPGNSFQVVLLDLCMPEIDGYEVAMRIQQRFRPEERPLVVALTANTDNESKERCMVVGMDGVIHKPVSLVEISVELTSLLKTNKATLYC